jgi:hypothetical protein
MQKNSSGTSPLLRMYCRDIGGMRIASPTYTPWFSASTTILLLRILSAVVAESLPF